MNRPLPTMNNNHDHAQQNTFKVKHNLINKNKIKYHTSVYFVLFA